MSLKAMNSKIENGTKEVLRLLEAGNPVKARDLIAQLFETDLEAMELRCTNHCCVIWIDISKRLRAIADPYERSQKILPEWKSFQDYIKREKTPVYQPALVAMQIGYFSAALELFSKLLDERDPLKKIDIYRNAGICYKKIGDFDKARVCLVEANDICHKVTKMDKASILAELADCYALCGEERKAKVLFREAFFKEPQAIDITFLDSDLINNVIKITKEKGYTGNEMLYWIPVFGSLYRVFNISRQLEPHEVRQLKNNIYALENEYKDPSCDKKILIPRLLNYAFRLIDFYNLQPEENAKEIRDLKNKMYLWDQTIYEIYVKQFFGKSVN